MSNRKPIFLVVLLGLVIVGLLLVIIFVPAPDRSSEPVPITDWETYRSEKYGFEIMHPVDWIAVLSDGPEPKINIYKEGETAKPPFIHHNNVTQVSIFPKGIGTEGVDSEMVTSTVRFGEPASRGIDFILKDGSKWATYAAFTKRPSSWQAPGFIWASVQIEDLSSECVLDGKVLPIEKCDLGIDRPEGAMIVRKGSVSSADRAIEERMLETFIFSQVTVRGEITCLPHRGNGPRTEECAIGLRGDDGKYYGLLGLDQGDIVSGKWTTGVRALVSGTMASAPESKYDIVGSITIGSIAPDGSN